VPREILTLPAGIDGHANRIDGLRSLPHAHRHEELELNLVLAGRADYLDAGNRRLVLSPGSLCWWFPDEDHLIIHTAPGTVMWVVVWRPSLVRSLVAQGADAALAARKAVGQRHAVVPAGIRRRLDALCLALTCHPMATIANPGAAFLLGHAWGCMAEACAAPGGADLHDAVAAVLRELRDDPSRSNGELARCVGLSPDRLARLVRQQLGCGLVELRTRRRLDVAFARHQAGGTLLAGAVDAGFASYAAFARACRRVYGTPPSAQAVSGVCAQSL